MKSVPASLQALAAAVIAVGFVNLSAFLEALCYDRLPCIIDAAMVIGFPVLIALSAAFVAARIEATGLPVLGASAHWWNERVSPCLVGVMLPATLAAIYPGIFPYRDYLHLIMDGAVTEVRPREAASSDAGHYRFVADAVLRKDLTVTISRRTGTKTSNPTYVTYFATPIVDADWSESEPIAAWAVGFGEGPEVEAGPLQGVRHQDDRANFAKAASTVTRRGLAAAEESVFVTLGGRLRRGDLQEPQPDRLVLGIFSLLSAIGAFVYVRREARRSADSGEEPPDSGSSEAAEAGP